MTALAKRLNQDGFAYVARADQKQTEDDVTGVRYLPLHPSLPSFGLMTAVIVVGETAWARRAASAYPDADIFLLQPGKECLANSCSHPDIVSRVSGSVIPSQHAAGAFRDAEGLSANGGDVIVSPAD